MPVPGVVHISQLQEQSTNRVEDVVKVGQTVDVWVRRVDPKKARIELTMIEPLPLEWREITKGMNLKGKVTRLEKFGAFVEIGAERPGLVHISEMTHGYIKSPSEVVKEDDEVEAQVLSVNRRKKQIKLSMKALEAIPEKPAKPAHQAVVEKEVVEEPKEEPVPTAMAMALKEAMERSNVQLGPAPTGKRRGKVANREMDTLLERTLQNKRK